ncbi:hypothetical protein ACH5RR_024694 [Cinchona calisaya]|uniref:ABC transporter domain-containing protein n=1 Tax=Cinchona calisaya TaxID=153742 RepID=A0ABD2YXG6_9GENT
MQQHCYHCLLKSRCICMKAFVSSGRLSKYLSTSECKPEIEKEVTIRILIWCWTMLLFPFQKGHLVVVIGEVASGKSSLISLILGEMRLINGSIHLTGSPTYVPQVLRFLQACTLDLDIALMMGGDMACIGEKGINLAGGQRSTSCTCQVNITCVV